MSSGLRDPAVLVHSSDLHIDDELTPRTYGGVQGLRAVLSKAQAVGADAVLLAGDTFDNARVSSEVMQEAASLMARAGMPIVLLPGNHDPILPGGPFERAGVAGLGNVFIFGIDGRERVEFPELNIEIIGFPHIGVSNNTPRLVPYERKLRWQVVMAHAHYVPPEEWLEQSYRSWRISDRHIAETKADYLALGHWDRAVQVGDGQVPAHYSGSPEIARSINVVRISGSTGVSVSREYISEPEAM